MKKIIYYSSKMGHSKKYAEDLAKKINAEVFDIKKIKRKVLKLQDMIIYVAPLKNNNIRKVYVLLKHYKKIKKKEIIIIDVGIQPSSKEKRDAVIYSNLLEDYHVRLYDLQGGIDLTKLSKFKKKFIKLALGWTLKKDKSLESYKDRVNYLLEHPYEFYDSVGMENIVNKINAIEKAKNETNSGLR